MSTEIIKVETQLNQSVETANKYFAAMQSNALQCQTLLSKYNKPFTSQAEYDEAYEALSKVKPVMEKVELRRKEITSGLDELKKVLMDPEKTIKASFESVKSLCDKWNQEIANKAAEEKRRIERETNTKIEFQEFVSMLINRIELFLTNTANGVEAAMIDYFSKMKLETFDKDAEVIRVPRVLRKQKYDELFSNLPDVRFDNSLENIIAEVQKSHSFDEIAKRYAEIMNPLMQPWIEKLDSKHKELEELAAMGEQARIEAEAKAIKEAEQAKAESEAKAKEEAERKESELKLQAEQAQIGIQFESQVQTQMVELPEGVRTNKTAVFDCQDKDLPTKICELVFKCIVNPKHPGIYQKDKKGIIKKNDDGIPMYADWLQSMLDFYAKNIGEGISGIKIMETVGTITRAKK